jgi:SAM-dependent methyltransferase
MTTLKCRACLTQLGEPFLSLGNQPLSNSYLRQEQLRQMEPTYPLDVYHCTNCHLVQLPEFEKAQNIFNEDYAYFSSYSTSWLEHCRKYVDTAQERFKLNSKSFVIEVASNDGYLLQYFKAKGIPALGVEPAAATARAAQEKGIPTDVCFFDMPYARKFADSGRKADLILGNNVLAHNPNLRDFVQALAIALKPEGAITLEFPHLLRMMQGNQFDTIYHEHYSYFSLHPLVRLLKEFALSVFDVDELPTHGGSLRIYVCHSGSMHDTEGARVRKVLADEKTYGLLETNVYSAYRNKVEKVKRDLLRFLIEAKEQGRRVVAYGAPAKGNTLLNYCGVRSDLIEFTVDKNPQKQNRYLPGTRIPIHPPDFIAKARPDYLLILPWNLKSEISDQMKDIRQWGGQFVTSIPQVEVF